jgi:hypothetical protein
MHTPYQNKLNHPADFRVKYRFYTKEEGGRYSTPSQGYRSDFWYESEGHGVNEIFMIWPEFENSDGEIIENTNPVSQEGTARMWVISPGRRLYHYDKIEIGLRCYMMEGNKKVAECEVIEIVGLYTNSNATI